MLFLKIKSRNSFLFIVFCSFCLSLLIALIHATFTINTVLTILGLTLFLSGIFLHFKDRNIVNNQIDIINNQPRLAPIKEIIPTRDKKTVNTDGGDYNERIEGNYIQGNYYAGGQLHSLSEAAAEIQKLLEQLEKSYSTETTVGKMAIATETISQIESNPTLSTRIISALKGGSVSAFEQFLNHPAASFVIGALEDWYKTQKH